MTSSSPSQAGSFAAAIVVAGGRARRMGGVDKLALPVGDRSLLDRVLAAAQPRCRRLVVVGPHRPTLTNGVTFVREDPPGGGPVPAVAAGLDAVGGAAFVVVLAADLPLLAATDVDHLVDVLADRAVDVAAAVDHQGRPNPLLAAYRVIALRARLAELGAAARGAKAARLLPPALCAVDLGNVATMNVNDPDDLEAARSVHARREP